MDTNTKALASLPHGPEFRFVENLVRLEAGKSGAAEYKVRGDEDFLRGHFPGQPLFPGVLLVEAVAQLAGIVAQCDPNIEPLNGLKLTAIQGAKIRGSARPGDTLELEATVIGRLGNLVQARGSVRVGDAVVLQTEIVLSGDKVF